MITADVAVVGAGPAGSAAATVLAHAGRRVLVVDRARFPRDKCCGDGLTAGALRHLERFGLRPQDLGSWYPVDTAWLRSPSGRTAGLPLPEPGLFAAVVSRRDLDAAMVDVARRAGATVHDGHALTSASVTPDGCVALEVDGLGTVLARYAVGADGMWSPLRRALGTGRDPYLGEWHAFRQYFRTSGAASQQLWVWFEPDLLPGYAWSFPLAGGRANVGFGIRRREGRPTNEMAAQWSDLLRRPHIAEVLGPDATPEAPHRAWPIPADIGGVDLSAGRGRVLFAGDAARATDPLTGEGIAQALETGELAARAILEAGPYRPDVAATRYRRAARANLARDHRLAAALSGLLAHDWGARGAIRAATATDWTRRNFARWMFEDYPRAVVLTPGRWRPGILHGPGAYRGLPSDGAA